MTRVISDCVQARSLISDELFARLCHRITIDENVEPEFAERIVDQALAFLGACAKFPDNRLAPSKPVDIGWHAFILCTKDYARFCQRVAGHFMHHVPQDVPGAPDHSKDPASVRNVTLESILQAGYRVDEELWIRDAYSCGGCDEDGNCAASGVSGNENTETRKN
ncbi:glycine-rich domain-containing protein [Saccharopolyspora sp. NPDC002376]